MTRIFCQNIKQPKLKFEVLHYDPETGIGTLKGDQGTEFTRRLTKDELTKYGYKIVKMENGDDAPRPRAPKKK